MYPGNGRRQPQHGKGRLRCISPPCHVLPQPVPDFKSIRRFELHTPGRRPWEQADFAVHVFPAPGKDSEPPVSACLKILSEAGQSKLEFVERRRSRNVRRDPICQMVYVRFEHREQERGVGFLPPAKKEPLAAKLVRDRNRDHRTAVRVSLRVSSRRHASQGDAAGSYAASILSPLRVFKASDRTKLDIPSVRVWRCRHALHPASPGVTVLIRYGS